MSPESFCYWLQGFSELHGEQPTLAQWCSIREHLSLVFLKVTSPGPGESPSGWEPFKPNWPTTPLDTGVTHFIPIAHTC